MIRQTALAAAVLWAAAPAGALDLALPVDCTPGADCYIQNLFDHDPGPAVADHACGVLTYDGHDGIDFALPTLAAMAAGVEVLAAAPGTVRGLRDGMDDIAQGGPDAPDVTGRECGNGVVIDHGNGWETQYCHLARGSVTVAPGDEVAAGTPLGRIGLSGQTEFPHLHFAIRRNGAEIDPFAPEGAPACGAAAPADLWSVPLPHPAGGLLDSGWATAVPDYGAIRAGLPDAALTPAAPAMVLWGLMFGGRAGDLVEIDITGPAGPLLDHAEALPRDQALFFRAAGLRAPPGGWPAGEYAGDIRILRDGAVIATQATRVTVAD